MGLLNAILMHILANRMARIRKASPDGEWQVIPKKSPDAASGQLVPVAYTEKSEKGQVAKIDPLSPPLHK
jgi:hypothetical protein